MVRRCGGRLRCLREVLSYDAAGTRKRDLRRNRGLHAEIDVFKALYVRFKRLSKKECVLMFAVQVRPMRGKYEVIGGIEDLDEAMTIREAVDLTIEPVPANLTRMWDAVATLTMPCGEDVTFLVVLRDTETYQAVVQETILSLCETKKRRTRAYVAS